MEKEEKYNRLVKQLQGSVPRLQEEEKLADEIMDRITLTRGQKYGPDMFGFLFGWTNIAWVRHALSVAAILVIALFMVQFASLNRKVSRLEKQLLPTNYRYYESPYRSSGGLIDFFPPGTEFDTDSIKISRKDLIELLNSSRRIEMFYDEQRTGLDYGILRGRILSRPDETSKKKSL